MSSDNSRIGVAAVIAFVVGLFIGLVVLGWWLFPVQWTDAAPNALSAEYQAIYVNDASQLYAQTGDAAAAQQALGGWGGDVAACELAQATADPNQRAQLEAVAQAVSGTPCATILAGAPVDGEEGGFPWGILALLAILLAIIALILWLFSRRSAAIDGASGPTYSDVPTSAPIGAGADVDAGEYQEAATVPIARFRTSYNIGHDTYDDSFSIENANGDFLGECGVGISESIGGNTPRNVTALEVWLFDKNDIRTITKVVMSDHAFFDEALKAKLAPKGEPVLARENEPAVLETASLIINAEITNLEYGTDTSLPPNSYFDQIVIELSAWAKEGDFDGPDIEGRVDELMDY